MTPDLSYDSERAAERAKIINGMEKNKIKEGRGKATSCRARTV